MKKLLAFFLFASLMGCFGGGGSSGGGNAPPPQVCKEDNFNVSSSEQDSNADYGFQTFIPIRLLDINEDKFRYLITFKQGTSLLKVKNILGVNFEKYLSNVSVAFGKYYYSDPHFISLLKNPLVLAIERDNWIQVLQTVAPAPIGDSYRGANAMPSGVARIKTTQAWGVAKNRGKNIRIGILDTGIDKDHEDLVDLRDPTNTIEGINYTDSGDPTDFTDRHSHGTHVSGTACGRDNNHGVVGVAPNCKLFAYKVLGDDGAGLSSWVISGINQSITDNMDVINLSFGSTDSAGAAYEQSFRAAEASNIVAVAASGNNGNTDNKTHYPASSDYTLSVGALNSSNQKASFSTYGATLDISAPGTSVNSTIPGSRYARKSGTSMATPHVSGAAALVREATQLSAITIKDILKCSASDLGDPGRDNQYGYGIVDAYKATSTSFCPETTVNYTHEVAAFSATKVSDRTQDGVLIKIDIDDLDNSGEDNINFELVVKDQNGKVIEVHEMSTDINGQDQAMITGYSCNNMTLYIQNFSRPGSSSTIKVKGQKETTI